MARPRKPIPVPPRRDFLREGGDVPADKATERERLEAMLPRVADPEAFRRDVVGVQTWLKWGLYEKARSDPKAVRDSLDDLHGNLDAALAALRALGPDAAGSLHRRAEMDYRPAGESEETPWQWLEPAGFDPCGRQRIRWVERTLADAARWAAEAQKSGEVRGAGRPRDDDAEEAMRRLVDIWRKQTGRPATIPTDRVGTGQKYGPFLDFCEEVISPIYRANGMKAPSIAPLARKVLYPSPAGERS